MIVRKKYVDVNKVIDKIIIYRQAGPAWVRWYGIIVEGG